MVMGDNCSATDWGGGGREGREGGGGEGGRGRGDMGGYSPQQIVVSLISRC